MHVTRQEPLIRAIVVMYLQFLCMNSFGEPHLIKQCTNYIFENAIPQGMDAKGYKSAQDTLRNALAESLFIARQNLECYNSWTFNSPSVDELCSKYIRQADHKHTFILMDCFLVYFIMIIVTLVYVAHGNMWTNSTRFSFQISCFCQGKILTTSLGILQFFPSWKERLFVPHMLPGVVRVGHSIWQYYGTRDRVQSVYDVYTSPVNSSYVHYCLLRRSRNLWHHSNIRDNNQK